MSDASRESIQVRTPALVGAALSFALALALLAGPGAGDADAARKARLVKGQAIAPKSAPHRVERAITAANRIARGKGYCYGGGHADWKSRCYDCSGAVSYALGDPGAHVVRRPRPSGRFMHWRSPGRGRWITVYANTGHMYAVIAGLRFDTSMTRGDGPGWSDEMRSARGYRKRHPGNL